MAYTLYIVSTPIGNLEDITLRALRVLRECSLILAEDTRHTRQLLSHFQIETPVESYHDFNKERVAPRYLEHLRERGDICLVSDAGTPGLADPGFNLVRDCIRQQTPVRALPGASALLAALVCAGLPTDRFRFEYFPAKKSATRLRDLEELKGEADSTLLFYASPHNLQKFLGEIGSVFGEVTIALMRELTKKFEEHLRGTPAQLLAHFERHPPRGEFVLLFHPQNKGIP